MSAGERSDSSSSRAGRATEKLCILPGGMASLLDDHYWILALGEREEEVWERRCACESEGSGDVCESGDTSGGEETIYIIMYTCNYTHTM